ncbi:MAG: GIY-YIG nuclease family protein [Chitinophagaceae bacterium]|nr:MAG: GIY-YIG nuclease family protein [Chitinophagaceae bacterium]
MACHVYILYSVARDRYYVGATCDELEGRLKRHNSNHKGFTGSKADWLVVYSEPFPAKVAAFAREREIKSWKSRSRIIELIQGGALP